MSNEDIRARLEARTQEEWEVSETTDDGFCIPGIAYLMGVNAEANAEFIAHAPTDLAELLAQLDAVRKAALEEGCQNVQHKPAEFVSRDMAIDAGEPTMEGTRLRGEIQEPCGACTSCRILAIVEGE